MNSDFFKEEVREGFCISAEMKKVWAVEMKVLSFVISVCKKYDIPYFEDMDIAVPCGHDDILTMLYGDYKVPVCNTSSHNYPFYAKQKEFLLENGYEV